MSQNKAGGIKARDIIYKVHGRDFYRRIGAMGGAASNTGGFYKNPELARKAGKLGGRISKRGPIKDPWMDYEFLDDNEPLFKPAKTLLDRIKLWDKR